MRQMQLYNITFITGQTCGRALKIADVLLKKGHTVNLITQGFPSDWGQFSTVMTCMDDAQMIRSIDTISDKTDIFHVHNEPSKMVSMVRDVTRKPVVLDVHDSYITRNGMHMTDERMNFSAADALVFVSEPVRDAVMSEFGLSNPTKVLPSYVPFDYYSYSTTPMYSGLCYEGRVTDGDGLEGSTAYCNYLDLAKKCKELEIDLHLYSGSSRDVMDKYKDYAFIHEPVSLKTLIRIIGRHIWNLVGNITKHSQWDLTCPNKLFDGIAAGLPPVVINAKWSADLVREYDIGIVVESLEELVDRWGECKGKLKNLMKVRGELSLDNHIHIVEDMYKEILS